jgi:uncharacterized protein involved in exopolysaccharide biosynthesis
MNEQHKKIEFKGYLRRRKKTFFLSFLIIFLSAVAVALILPNVYSSQATILIEEQKIPKDYVRSSVTSYAEERIEAIKTEVLSGHNLQQLINNYDLYQKLRESHSEAEINEEMRNDITLETISAKEIDRKTGKYKSMTIAFTLSYEGLEPSKVKSIVDEISSSFVKTETAKRERNVSETTVFLEEELDGLKKQIHLHEKKISNFKGKNIGQLPENVGTNLEAISRLERTLDGINNRIQSLQETKILLEGQLASVEPLNPVFIDGQRVATNPREQLKRLYIELASLEATLSEKHPDVKRLKREIRELEEQVGKSDTSVAKLKRLHELKSNLADIKGTYGSKHPDVIKISNEIKLLEKELSNEGTGNVTTMIALQNPDNPAYITLKSRILATSAELSNLLPERDRVNREIQKYQKKIEMAPLTEREYSALVRDYEGTKRKYDEMLNHLMEVRVSQEMVEKEQGERFTIIDHANLPKKPIQPNRLGIILLGFVVALGTGFGLGAIRESMDDSVKSASDIQNLTGAPVLSVVSFIESTKEKWNRRLKNLIWIFGIICLISVALLFVDEYVMKLDQLWPIFIERINVLV